MPCDPAARPGETARHPHPLKKSTPLGGVTPTPLRLSDRSSRLHANVPVTLRPPIDGARRTGDEAVHGSAVVAAAPAAASGTAASPEGTAGSHAQAAGW
eukprot:365045-Chlamydomonas_euryale.AAC.2